MRRNSLYSSDTVILSVNNVHIANTIKGNSMRLIYSSFYSRSAIAIKCLFSSTCYCNNLAITIKILTTTNDGDSTRCSAHTSNTVFFTNIQIVFCVYCKSNGEIQT